MELSENLTHIMPVVTHMIHVSLALCGEFKQAPVTLLKKPILLTFYTKLLSVQFLSMSPISSCQTKLGHNHSTQTAIGQSFSIQLSLHWGTTRIGAWSSLLNIHHHPWSICSHVFITISMLMILSSLCPCCQKTSLSWCGSQIWPTNFRWFSLVMSIRSKKNNKTSQRSGLIWLNMLLSFLYKQWSSL